MKKFLSILCLAALTYHSNAMAYSIVEVRDTTIQPKSDDTLRLRIGQMKIDIYPDSSAVIQVANGKKKPQVEDFAWYGFSGLRYGFLNLMDENEKIQTEGWLGNTGRRNVSSHVAFNVLNATWDLDKSHVRICTGLGFQFNTIALNKEYKLQEQDSLTFITGITPNYKLSTLNANYIQVPFVFQFNGRLKKDSDGDYSAFHSSIGCIGSYLIGSNAYYKWEQDGEKKKQRLEGNYGLNPFQFDIYADFGFGDVLTWYLQTGLLSVFKENKGPELYSLSTGLKINF
ncbi:MAG: hypothetical protein ACK5HD_05270 [Bacteroidota bacterium]